MWSCVLSPPRKSWFIIKLILSHTIQSPISKIQISRHNPFSKSEYRSHGTTRSRRQSAPGSGHRSQERRDGHHCWWLSLVNYHHHLFYIREPFVTKKGILTVCLMGETFKLERQYIYQRPVRASGAARLTSKIWVSLVSVGGQIYLHTSLTRKLRRQQLPSVFCSKLTGHRFIFLTGRQKKSSLVPIWSTF